MGEFKEIPFEKVRGYGYGEYGNTGTTLILGSFTMRRLQFPIQYFAGLFRYCHIPDDDGIRSLQLHMFHKYAVRSMLQAHPTL